ncbi:hypothetical protein PUN28_020589 [Cardiocondyla obscurior]|uniref:Uncharacterized protein n=1 Tax=Cardiocondyla obscurior TaxID=286306 RepID=A0AAW2E7C8_9HYME
MVSHERRVGRLNSAHSSPSFGSQRVRSGCASSRNENETPRECGAASRRGPSSLGRQPGPTFTFITPLGIADPNDSVADRYRSPELPRGTFAGLSKVNRTTNSGPGPVTALGPGSRRSTRGEVHDDENAGHRRAAACPRASREAPRGIAHRREASVADDESPRSIFGFLRFTPERFHVLLNSLFKVLFNFPSRYLFAIGLVVVFSLRWSLPPT